MKTYALKNNTGEAINYVHAYSLIEAQEIFAEIKKLEINDLLEIFIVEEV